MTVEAYVVKGMNTPFLLGNDFSDQYALSIVRKEDKTWLVLGNSGRKVPVENSIGPHLKNEQGHVFGIIRSRFAKQKSRRKDPKSLDVPVRVRRSCIIPPESVAAVAVEAMFSGGIESLYVEKVISARRGLDDLYGSLD